MPPRKRARGTSPRRGTSLGGALVRLLGQALRRGAPLWVLCLLIGVGIAVARHQLTHSPAFVIQRVHTPTAPGWRQPESLIGEPQIQVDVAAVAAELQRANPQMKSVRVTRRWPAELVVEAIPRRPIAQVRLREFFPLDEEGFIFASGTPAPQPTLPIIEGVEQLGKRVTAGTVSTAPHVHLALRVLETLRTASSLRGETVTLLNVADAHQLTFRLQRGIEVRIGDAEDVPKTLERLGPVLAKLEEQQLTPQYIDLRFDDPVIGPR